MHDYNKNAKGFTMIELLAVIIILGLLLAIAIPAINRQLAQFRLNYYEDLETSVESSGKDYMTDKRYAKPTKLLYSKIVKVSDLENEGYIDEIEDYVGNKCDNTDTSYSYVVVVKTGDKTYDYTACLKCSGDDYATDTSGEENDYCNEAWLTNDNIVYDYNYNSDTLYVYYGTNEEEIKEQVGLTYNTIKQDSEGNELASVSGDDEAVYPQNINELVGKNVNTVVTLNYTLPDGTQLTKDALIYKHNAPKVTMEYTNGNSATGKSAGDTYTSGEWSNGVKVTIAFSDSDIEEIFTNGGITIGKVEYYDGSSWKNTGCTVSASGKTCVWTISSNFNKTVKFRITNNNGFVSDESSEVTIKVDIDSPSCTNSGDSTTWTSNDRTIYYGCSDSGSGCNSSYSGGSKKFSTTTKQSTIAGYTIMDNAGNDNSCAARTANVYVDKDKPTCEISTTSSSYNNDATYEYKAKLTATDNDSGINSSKTYISNGSTKKYGNGSQVSTGNTNTSYTFTAYCVDKAGNTNTATTTVELQWNLESEGVYYTNLASAISDVSSDNIIKVLRNYTDSSSPTVNKNITLNINGKTLTKKNSGITVSKDYTLNITGSGNLKSDGKINLLYDYGTLNITGSGLKIIGNDTYSVVIISGENAKLTGANDKNSTNSVKIYNDYDEQYTNDNDGDNQGQALVVENGATVTINNSNFEAYSYMNRAVEVRGTSSTLTLTSGTLANGISSSGDVAPGARAVVAIRAGATFTMNGGSLTGYAKTNGSAGIVIMGNNSNTISKFYMYGGTITIARIGSDNCVVCGQGYAETKINSTKTDIKIKATENDNYRIIWNRTKYSTIEISKGSSHTTHLEANIKRDNYFFVDGNYTGSYIKINSGVTYCKKGSGEVVSGNVTNNGSSKCS